MPVAKPSTDYRQHLEIETPESVVLDYEIAGIGSRALAAILDTVILIVWTMAVVIILGMLSTRLKSPWANAAAVLIYFASLWGYFALFEGFRHGQTPGKRIAGIRVVRDTGHAVTFGAAAVRNLLRVADFAFPPPYFLGALLVALHPRGKRLGDLAAGTVVVRDQPMEIGATPEPAAHPQEDVGPPELSGEEFRLLREFQERASGLRPEARHRLAERLVVRFQGRLRHRAGSEEDALAELYRLELLRQRGRFASSARRGPGTAERLAGRKADRWREFETLADRAAQRGLDGFAAAELPDFAARYREVAADLARARTYQADPGLLARLERPAAAGHNALYRDERRSVTRAAEVLFRECPAAIYRARGYVLVALLAFWAPAAAGFALLRDRPALAEELLPDVMLRRAEAGASRIEEGKGYFEMEERVRPELASYLITNNIGVAFVCFAGGIFLGVGSLMALGYNGLEFGISLGHYANVGMLRYLVTFVVGHGVLELFAICLAGAAGLMLGRAIVAPGDLPRGEALVLNARIAIRLIGAVIVFLLLAGMIEGFLSASPASLAYRLVTSGASLTFLVLYLLNGVRYARGS